MARDYDGSDNTTINQQQSLVKNNHQGLLDEQGSIRVVLVQYPRNISPKCGYFPRIPSLNGSKLLDSTNSLLTMQ